MPNDVLSQAGGSPPDSAPGPFPIENGWGAGDFRNGDGLLGLVKPGPTLAGAPPATSWRAGDFQQGLGLLGLVAPSGYDAAPAPWARPAEPIGPASLAPLVLSSLSATDASGGNGGPPDEDPVANEPGLSADDDDPEGASAFPSDEDEGENAALDYGLATPGDASFLTVATNRTLKRQWSRREGRDWPVTEDGRSHHGHHYIPVADGGPKTLDNFGPMHPDEHMAHHMANGDFARWAKERWLGLRGGKAKGTSSGGGAGLLPGPKALRLDPEIPDERAPAPPHILRLEPGRNATIPEVDPDEVDGA